MLRTIGAGSVPRLNEIGLDGRVLAFTMAASILTGLLSGLAPAWRAGRLSLQESLQESGRSVDPEKRSTRSVLVVVEMALALILLVGAGLLIRSFYRLNHVNSGFAYDHLLSFILSLPERKYATPEQRADFYNLLIQGLSALPGVQSAGMASGLPFGASSWRIPFVVEGGSVPPMSDLPLLEACLVSPNYFRTMGIPLRAGRYFTEQDNRQHLASRGLNAIIIDEEFARRYWPNEDAIGKHVRLGPIDPGSPILTVVGVVDRVKMDRLNIESNRVQGYFPYSLFSFPNMTVVIKSTLEPAQIISAAQQQVQAIDSHQPIYNIRTMEEIRAVSVAPERLNLMLLGLFAVLALVLAAVGMYSVVSSAVTQRAREIGIRMALGAQPRDVIGLIVREGMILAFIGIAIGLAASLALMRLMSSLLFGVSPTDPATFALISLFLLAVALLACYIPAQRVMKVDPLVALRND